jgi:hypothetical protein
MYYSTVVESSPLGTAAIEAVVHLLATAIEEGRDLSIPGSAFRPAGR